MKNLFRQIICPEKPVTSHTHADMRANIPTEELHDFIAGLDTWDAKNTFRAFLSGKTVDRVALMVSD